MIKRDHYLKILSDTKDLHVIKIVTGVRRCGKSTILQQFQDELRNQGVSDKNIIAFNLDTIDNAKLATDANLLYDTILQLADPNKMNYVFLDEVQIVNGFEKLINSLFAKESIDLYITGSNAYVTSSELATFLSGRYIEIKLQPLCFSEFVQFFPENNNYQELFEKFMRYGGFPEVANFLAAGSEARIPLYLQSIYDTVVEKDIRHRRNFQSMDNFNNTIRFVLDNVGSITSPKNISKSLENNGSSPDNKTVSDYLEAAENCYVIYRAQRYDIRGKELLKTLVKFYSVDLGLTNVVLGLSNKANLGHRLENIVYLELLKRYGNVQIGKNNDKEIDFRIVNSNGEVEYYQVALSTLNEAVFEREIAPLRNTGDGYKKMILTMDYQELNDNGISQKNIINWLLDR